MNGQDNQVFQQDLSVEENQERNFIAAVTQARREGAPLQVFQNLLNDAPPVSVEVLYHIARGFLRHTTETNVVRLLLEHEPKIARHKDPSRHGGLLLHQAISSYNVPVETIELILDAHPEAIREKDINGLLPFHLAYERSAQTAELLLSRFPDAAGVSYGDQNGRQFPLHRCLQRTEMNRSDAFMLNLIDAYPAAASIKTGQNWTALHLACKRGFSLAVTQRLHQLYPEAVMLQNNAGQIPLHVACKSENASVEVVQFLLEKYPEGAQSKDLHGRLPLHSAVRDASLDFIQVLIKACPHAVNLTDNSGKLSLHTACNTGASLEIIQLLLDHYTGDEEHNNGLSITDNDGRLPIHYYVRYYARSQNASPDTLQHLLDRYPDGIRAVDNEGLLPLHHACDAHSPTFGIIPLLVEAVPYSVIQKSANGQTPLQFARGTWEVPRRRANFGVMQYLLRRQNEAVTVLKEAFTNVASLQLSLPDLVVANVWSFAKPDLWTPTEEDWNLS